MADQGEIEIMSSDDRFRREVLKELQTIEEQLRRIADHLEKYQPRQADPFHPRSLG